MEGCLLVQPLLIVLVRLHTKFLLRIEYFFLRCCFFRFIFSDVDLNPIMHSSVWCVVLTFLLLLLTTQDGNGKLFIFCCQNLNRFSSLASPYKFSGRTRSYSNPYPTTIRDVTWARFAWNAVLVPRVFRPRLRAHNGTREDAWQPCPQS